MTDADPKYAIHAAARDGNLSKVESLLNSNPKLAFQYDDDGRLPIHWAVSYNHLPIIKLLVQVKNFDPDVKDELMGWTPLMMACSRKQDDAEEVVSLLLAKGADPNEKTHRSQTALHFAASKAHLPLVRTLLQHGGSARIADSRQQYALHRAAAVGSVPIISALLDVGRGQAARLDAADADGMTPLHHALAEGQGEAALVLLRRGAASACVDANGLLPIEGVPDAKVREYVLRMAEGEGLEICVERGKG